MPPAAEEQREQPGDDVRFLARLALLPGVAWSRPALTRIGLWRVRLRAWIAPLLRRLAGIGRARAAGLRVPGRRGTGLRIAGGRRAGLRIAAGLAIALGCGSRMALLRPAGWRRRRLGGAAGREHRLHLGEQRGRVAAVGAVEIDIDAGRRRAVTAPLILGEIVPLAVAARNRAGPPGRVEPQNLAPHRKTPPNYRGEARREDPAKASG